ncbi:MAG: flagellar protein export ATPase FliI [Rhizobiaceae bacterium]|nr:flagellar protein export ATPase FliI [Rhizobiaceae bacterium]MCV0407026.1 flagellar protein export ATPase FliI [Rhizobiaceae bacterium]
MLPQPTEPIEENALLALERSVAKYLADDALVRRGGSVGEVAPTQYRVNGLSKSARLGDLVERRGAEGASIGEVIRIERSDLVVAPYDINASAGIGDPVFLRGPFAIAPHESWHGRVVDALGHPLDGKGPLRDGDRHATSRPPAALERQRVDAPFATGVRVVDIFTPLCYGQRIGIFAGSGVGKSTLLAMLAAAHAFDTVVVAMIGERGREVREFLEDTLGEAAMAKTVAVVATSDASAMMRRRAPGTAMAIAEHFRDRGRRVLLILDSITRYAHALREVAIGAGEPPVARGYPASVFTELPKLLERAGPGANGAGSITAILSVLVDGDDHNDPVSDSVRGILDGHVVMERSIADQGRYPAVNPLASVSRLADKCWSPDQKTLVQRLRAMISRFEDTRDIRLLGAYQPGADAELDMAVRQVPAIYEALGQSPGDGMSADPFADLATKLKARDRQGEQG